MKISTDGLIIGEQNIGEQDRLITVLTRERGIIKAFVKNCRSLKSAKGSATRLLCYSRLVLYINRDTYIVDEATSEEMFIKLRTDIVNMSLAQYFCELVGHLAPKESKAEEYLRLMLNALYLLCNNKRPLSVIKSAVELRMLCFSGYMPDLVCCNSCKCYESEVMYFLPKSGRLVCGDCIHDINEQSIKIGMGVTTAMRYCIYAEQNKMFNFKLSDNGLKLLESCCEQYLFYTTSHNFKTLEFYKTISL
ncbi:MAG: DNA repair protein RecO [Acutalibacteraceae bacterium]|nr:DNA repair protein RecO [Acutalibacteraceae bacterium]